MVLPVYDDNPTRRVAYVTWALIATNVAVFLLSPVRVRILGEPTAHQLCDQKDFYQRYAAIPQELVHLRPLAHTYAFAAGQGCHLVDRAFDKDVLLSAVTYMFVHGGVLHLVGNMLFLAIFGNNVEDRLGRFRFLIFYLVSGIVSALCYALVNSSGAAPLVGASGAIAGVLGAYLVLYPRAPVTGLLFFLIPLRLPAWIVLGVWFAIQSFYARGAAVAVGEVAYLVHVVGFVLGMGYAILSRNRLRQTPEAEAGSEPHGP